MKRINLRGYYPNQYQSDCFIKVPDEVEDIFTTSKRKELSYRRRKYYSKAQYSLDREDGIENHILNSDRPPRTFMSRHPPSNIWSKLFPPCRRNKPGGSTHTIFPV
ncbi:MAG: hypothetical protein ABF904_02050 [Ethanoligenens sp.]